MIAFFIKGVQVVTHSSIKKLVVLVEEEKERLSRKMIFAEQMHESSVSLLKDDETIIYWFRQVKHYSSLLDDCDIMISQLVLLDKMIDNC